MCKSLPRTLGGIIAFDHAGNVERQPIPNRKHHFLKISVNIVDDFNVNACTDAFAQQCAPPLGKILIGQPIEAALDIKPQLTRALGNRRCHKSGGGLPQTVGTVIVGAVVGQYVGTHQLHHGLTHRRIFGDKAVDSLKKALDNHGVIRAGIAEPAPENVRRYLVI